MQLINAWFVLLSSCLFVLVDCTSQQGSHFTPIHDIYHSPAHKNPPAGGVHVVSRPVREGGVQQIGRHEGGVHVVSRPVREGGVQQIGRHEVHRPTPHATHTKPTQRPSSKPKYWGSPVQYNSRPSLDFLNEHIVSRSTLDVEMKLLIASGQVPVVYAAINGIMKFMRYNIEMASRLNPVIVIADSLTQISITSPYNNTDPLKRTAQPVFYLPQSLEGINDFKDFPKNYEPIDGRAPQGRKEFEMQTWYRWLMVSNTVALFQIPQIFHGDNDAMVCGNMTTHLALRRAAQGCDVILSVQGDQPTNDQSWLGHLSGHATFWSLPALLDLREFWLEMWRHHKATLKLTGLHGKPGEMGITDMALLYLYYVAHSRNATGWDTGKPQSFRTGKLRVTDEAMQDFWQRYDFKWNQTRDTLSMPNIINPNLKMCNGLDIVERTALDHMWAFYSTSFSLNENSTSAELLRHFSQRHQHHQSQQHSTLMHQEQPDGSVLLLPSNSSRGPVYFSDPLTQFLPYIIGLTSFFGGRAESFDREEVARLSHSAIYFPVLHYQSSSKFWCTMDACKRLVSRTQYYMEHYHKPDFHKATLEKILRESDTIVEEHMLERFVDPFLREDCREILQHRSELWPYMDTIHD